MPQVKNTRSKKVRIAMRVVDDGEIRRVEHQTLELSLLHVRYYDTAVSLLASVSSCARQWLDFLAQRTDTDGYFLHTARQRMAFNLMLLRAGGEGYSDGAVKKGSAELTNVDLVRRCHRGRYQINPRHLWKGSEATRLQALRTYYNDPTIIN